MRNCGCCCDRKCTRAVMLRCEYRFVVTPVNVGYWWKNSEVDGLKSVPLTIFFTTKGLAWDGNLSAVRGRGRTSCVELCLPGTKQYCN